MGRLLPESGDRDPAIFDCMYYSGQMEKRTGPRRPAGGARALARRRRHDRILEAATRLFADPGFAKTTVEEIAVRAGVSKGLLYDHHPSKEALLEAVWARQVEAWTQATTLELKYAPGALAETIGSVLAISVRHALGEPLLRRILMQDPGSLSGGNQATDIAAFGRVYRDRLEPVLAHGVRSGELRPDLDVAYTAELIWLLHFTLIREIFIGTGRGLRADADALLRATIALVVSGLRAP
jgi:AcrR family transcriptional regulator